MLAALCLVAGTAHADALRVMPLGDSITRGAGSCSYRTPLVRSLGSCSVRMVGREVAPGGNPSNCITSNVNHEGHSGWRTNEFLRSASSGGTRLKRYVSAADPDVVLLHIGSNDMNRREEPGTYDAGSRTGTGTIGRIDAMLNDIFARAPSATIFVADLIPWLKRAEVNAGIGALRPQIRSLVARRAADGERVVLVNVSDGFTADMLQSDLVHPNARGDAHIASRWRAAMRSAGFCADGGTSGGGTSGGSTGGGGTSGGGTSGGGSGGGSALRIEAESGTLVGAMRSGGDGAASGGAYVSVPGSGSSGARRDYVALPFRVGTAGTYRLRARVQGPSGTSNSFFVELGQSDTWKWHTRRSSSYVEEYVDHAGGGEVRVWLDAGTHTAKVFRRENGTRLDWLALEYVAEDRGGDVDGDGVGNAVDPYPNDSARR